MDTDLINNFEKMKFEPGDYLIVQLDSEKFKKISSQTIQDLRETIESALPYYVEVLLTDDNLKLSYRNEKHVVVRYENAMRILQLIKKSENYDAIAQKKVWIDGRIHNTVGNLLIEATRGHQKTTETFSNGDYDISSEEFISQIQEDMESFRDSIGGWCDARDLKMRKKDWIAVFEQWMVSREKEDQ